MPDVNLKDLVTGLRSRLRGVEGVADDVLSTLDMLGNAIAGFDGIDPQTAREAIQTAATRQQTDGTIQSLTTERDGLSTQLQQQQQANADLRKQLEAVRGLGAAGVRSQYEELLLPKVTQSMQLDGDTVKLPENFWQGLKTQYPDMFHAEDAAGTGGAAAGGAAPDKAPSQVTVGDDRIISGVNPADVLSGNVAITEG